MSVSLDESEPQMLFSLSDLMEVIGEGSNSSRLFWNQYVIVHPDNPDQLFVVVFSTRERGSYLLKYDRASGEVQQLLSSGYFANHSLGLSPDSHYLVFGGTDELDPVAGEESALLQVYDLQRDEVIPFLSLAADFAPYTTYDWSRDGQWLALLLNDGMVGIFSPEARQLRLIATPEGACGTPVWIN
jgi:hypothetical protein